LERRSRGKEGGIKEVKGERDEEKGRQRERKGPITVSNLGAAKALIWHCVCRYSLG